MDSNHLQHITSVDKASVDKKQHEDGKKLLKQLHHQGNKESQSQSQSQPVSFSPASPPSASSSPSHEFSFTISLHHSSSNINTTTTTTTPADKATNSNKPPPSLAIDLSPADDIFFHGHLLPLHLLSHLPVSPRTSTNSMDSFTLPVKDLSDNQKPTKESNINCNTTTSTISHNNSNKKISNSKKSQISSNKNINNSDETMNGGRSNKCKSSFSLLGFTRWRKGCEEVREIGEDKEEKQKRKLLRFDLSQVVKRYMRMVQPLLFFKGRRDNMRLNRQAYSFSGNLAVRNNKPADLRGRRGEFSAPASMRTSPSNSGLLVATATLPSSTSDSTMEELQAAIQAAIAHCKNSIASDDKLKC
ncbi:BRI1 kinase inhibitor 1 [Ziziphus jujuba]|uniref:BRI1 kinase inhibitor 1 n=1 Tax=Ziziphus jujuba TaxID=326968 RepID=A0A6P3ZYW4_ZIZJJ|nr:BRI1 kinase inhibitor 1 [Ziziphus jujuba]